VGTDPGADDDLRKIDPFRSTAGGTMTAKEWTMRLLGHGQLPATVPGSVRKYMVREHLAAIRDDVAILDEEGEPVFSVDGRAQQLRDTLILRDRYDAVLYRIPPHELHQTDAMAIEGDGGTAAEIRRGRTPGGHDHWTVTVPGRESLRLLGAVADHEYRIESGERRVAEISKQWFRQPHTYGVAVSRGEDGPLLLMIAAAVDQMAR
jgi:uncharacterized protein YxjI